MAAYDYDALQKVVQHALGKPLDTQLSTPLELINDAINEVGYAHPWRWRQVVTSLTTATVAGAGGLTGILTMPADFAGVFTLHEQPTSPALSVVREIVPVKPGLSQKDHSTYRYAYTRPTTIEDDVTMTQHYLRLYPSTNSIVCDLVYLRLMDEIDGSAGTDKPAMPLNFHRLLKQCLRAHALLEDHQAEGQPEYEKYLRMLESYKLEDTNSTSARVATPGGIISRGASAAGNNQAA